MLSQVDSNEPEPLYIVLIKKSWLSQSIQILTVCQINLPSDVKENKDKYIFKHSKNDTTKDINILDKNDNEFEKLSIGPKFKYYQNHKFHKLKQNLTKPRTVSIFHTNIISLNANHENLEILSVD